METVRELMNFSSFWTIWFWIAHIVAWSMASHFALGGPFDMIMEANREKDDDGPWSRATENLILAQVFRFHSMGRKYGTALTAISAFILSVLATMCFYPQMEFARALLTILGPLTLIYFLSIRTVDRIEAEQPRGRALRDAVRRQRFWNQVVGLLAVLMATVAAIAEFVRGITPVWY